MAWWLTMKMTAPGKAWRWGILAVLAGTVLLIRIFREEWLQGKNPLLFLLLAIALFFTYRFAKK